MQSEVVNSEAKEQHLHADELRAIAKAFRAKQLQKQKPSSKVYTKEEIEPYIEELERFVREAAEAGHLKCYYTFKSNQDSLMRAVASAFRYRVHEGFMIIVDGGRKRICVRWDGQYHV